ncbi:MAG: M23 family metallopeptidase [Formosimonas sp.]
MKKTNQTTILVLDKSQNKTSTYRINTWLLRNLKPTLIALSVSSVVLATGLVVVATRYYIAQQDNHKLKTQVEYLDGYTSAEAAAKINDLKKTEKTINELEDYLQQRGANNPPPKGKNDADGKASMGGEFRPIAAELPFSTQYNQKVQQLLTHIKNIPIGVPHTGILNSRFGNRANPFGGGGENHSGLDFKGEIGEPIQVTAAGEVVYAGRLGGYGNAIKIKHGFEYETLYGHLSEINVTVGQKVNAGDVIGQLGNTGRSTGPHLHYEVRLQGAPIDPEKFLTLNH